ncbi:RloB family protein [Streptomyces sp. NPDC088923]|uniref:RloB family protein n=1 Tax=Streptomyces sp. NPDC088923 TaxID=3365913 RepID=UPI0038153A7C
MGRGKPLGRRKPKRPEQRRVLIYCEGRNTEADYLKGLRAELSGTIRIAVGSAHGTPLKLVRDALKHRDRAPNERDDQFTAYEDVWCVMDVEAPKPHGDLSQALKLADAEGIKVVLSNPCFELWILLHFSFHAGWMTSDQAQRTLEKHGGTGYDGQRKKVDYLALRSGIEQAMKNAARLRAHHGGSAKPHQTNPWTDVDRLVHDLRRQRDEARS